MTSRLAKVVFICAMYNSSRFDFDVAKANFHGRMGTATKANLTSMLEMERVSG
jgi:hypothetical protein